MACGSLFHYLESLLHHTSFRSTILQSFTFRSINQKYQKYLLYCLSISIRSHFCKWPWRDWQPLYRVGCKLLIVCAGIRWLVRCLLLDWYLGSQNWGKYLLYFLASPFPLQGKTNTSSRSSRKNFWRRCRGRSTPSQDIPSTHNNLSSLALHYYPFASCFPLPHF